MDSTVSYIRQLENEAAALALRAAPKREIRLTPGAAFLLSGEPLADFNVAVLDDEQGAEDRLREFHRIIEERKLPAFVVLSDVLSARLGQVAAALGFRHTATIPLMTFTPRAAPEPSAGYDVRRVADEEGLRASHEIVAKTFGFPAELLNCVFGPLVLDAPGLDIFLVFLDEVPMSTGWTSRAGRFTGISSMATLPDYQRRGAGRAFLRHALTHHLQHGVETFYLEATAAGQPLYERVGFRTVAETAVWVWGRSTQYP